MDAQTVFRRYEELRRILPTPGHQGEMASAGGLIELAGKADVFVFDAYGVLNVGGTAIAGAADAVRVLRTLGKRLFVLTNAASLNRARTEAKFAALGFDFRPEEIISSRDATLEALARHGEMHGEVAEWGVIADPSHRPADLPCAHRVLGDDPRDYDRVGGFLFLSANAWNDSRQQLLTEALARRGRALLVGNPDLVSPREGGLAREPGWYSSEIADITGITPEFHGKPFPSVYGMLMRALPADQPRERIMMLGDTLHTDILGAQAQGWQAGLVTEHGLFAGLDVRPFIEASGIRPDWIMPSI